MRQVTGGTQIERDAAGHGYIRQDLTDSIGYDGSSYPYDKISPNFDVYRQRKDGEIMEGGRSAGIAIDYINGEDPAYGFQEQQLFQVTFKVKF